MGIPTLDFSQTCMNGLPDAPELDLVNLDPCILIEIHGTPLKLRHSRIVMALGLAIASAWYNIKFCSAVKHVWYQMHSKNHSAWLAMIV